VISAAHLSRHTQTQNPQSALKPSPVMILRLSTKPRHHLVTPVPEYNSGVSRTINKSHAIEMRLHPRKSSTVAKVAYNTGFFRSARVKDAPPPQAIAVAIRALKSHEIPPGRIRSRPGLLTLLVVLGFSTSAQRDRLLGRCSPRAAPGISHSIFTPEESSTRSRSAPMGQFLRRQQCTICFI